MEFSWKKAPSEMKVMSPGATGGESKAQSLRGRKNLPEALPAPDNTGLLYGGKLSFRILFSWTY